MKHHRVSPHGNRYRIVAICEAVGADEESLRLGGNPDYQQEQQIDKVAEVGQKIMVAPLPISVISDGHEVAQLDGKPEVEKVRIASDQVSADKNI